MSNSNKLNNFSTNNIIQKISNYIDHELKKNTQINKTSKKKLSGFNEPSSILHKLIKPNAPLCSLGTYTTYAINDPDLIFEYLDETSLIIKNTDIDTSNNTFKWKNILNNKINNLIYIHTHLITIPTYPFLNKKQINLTISPTLNTIMLNLLNQYNVGNKNLSLDSNISIGTDIINVSYYDNEIIDFIINQNYLNLYSIIISDSTLYLYTRSSTSILLNNKLYLDIDINNNLKLTEYETTMKNIKKFNFQLQPIHQTNNFVYYKGIGQYIKKSINELINIDNFYVQLFDSSYNELNNKYINNKLYQTNQIQINACNCFESDIFLSSCYCKYIRHPLNLNNQIDVGLKIGQIKNELVHNVFN
jgi:hypothetical protein